MAKKDSTPLEDEIGQLYALPLGEPGTRCRPSTSTPKQLGWPDVGGRPLSMVIDRDGTVRECIIGGRDYAEFEAEVKKYLALS